MLIRGVLKFRVPFRSPNSKDYNILGSILGSPLFWETTIVWMEEIWQPCTPNTLPRNCNMGASKNEGYHLKSPHKKDSSLLESTLGSPYFWKLPYNLCCRICSIHCRLGPKVGNAVDIPQKESE